MHRLDNQAILGRPTGIHRIGQNHFRLPLTNGEDQAAEQIVPSICALITVPEGEELPGGQVLSLQG
jgi:hypothetical protein